MLIKTFVNMSNYGIHPKKKINFTSQYDIHIRNIFKYTCAYYELKFN